MAIVDTGVHIRPTKHTISGSKHRFLHVAVLRLLHIIHHKIVGADFSPFYNLIGVFAQLIVGSSTYVIDVIAGGPKVFLCNGVCWIERQVILTRGEYTCGQCNSCYKKLID